ncbi:MAG: hypothetical protein WD966_03625 [Nitrosopumilaceae archaeon]
MKKAILSAIVALAFMGGSAIIGFLLESDSEVRPEICQGTAACFRGKVTQLQTVIQSKLKQIQLGWH